MPLAIQQEQLNAPPSVLRRRPWTRRDCEALESSGAFEGQRYELIEGELIDKMGMNPPHSVFLKLIGGWLMRIFGERYVRQQMPIDVRLEDNPTNEPQPYVWLTSQPANSFLDRHPNSSEILLLVEVADTTLAFDTTTKAAL
jgi:hypothetical protein